MSDGGGDGEDNSSEQDARRCHALILLAKLAGRVRPGQLEQGYWLRAAQLGSAEAQLQCGGSLRGVRGRRAEACRVFTF